MPGPGPARLPPQHATDYAAWSTFRSDDEEEKEEEDSGPAPGRATAKDAPAARRDVLSDPGDSARDPQLDSAAAQLAAAAAAEFAEAAAWKEKGNAAFARGDYAAALEAYTAGLRQAPSAALFCNRSLCFLRLSPPRAADALRDASRALLLEPASTKARVRQAQAFAASAIGRPDLAVEALAAALEIAPRDAELKRLLRQAEAGADAAVDRAALRAAAAWAAAGGQQQQQGFATPPPKELAAIAGELLTIEKALAGLWAEAVALERATALGRTGPAKPGSASRGAGPGPGSAAPGRAQHLAQLRAALAPPAAAAAADARRSADRARLLEYFGACAGPETLLKLATQLSAAPAAAAAAGPPARGFEADRDRDAAALEACWELLLEGVRGHAANLAQLLAAPGAAGALLGGLRARRVKLAQLALLLLRELLIGLPRKHAGLEALVGALAGPAPAGGHPGAGHAAGAIAFLHTAATVLARGPVALMEAAGAVLVCVAGDARVASRLAAGGPPVLADLAAGLARMLAASAPAAVRTDAARSLHLLACARAPTAGPGPGSVRAAAAAARLELAGGGRAGAKQPSPAGGSLPLMLRSALAKHAGLSAALLALVAQEAGRAPERQAVQIGPEIVVVYRDLHSLEAPSIALLAEALAAMAQLAAWEEEEEENDVDDEKKGKKAATGADAQRRGPARVSPFVDLLDAAGAWPLLLPLASPRHGPEALVAPALRLLAAGAHRGGAAGGAVAELGGAEMLLSLLASAEELGASRAARAAACAALRGGLVHPSALREALTRYDQGGRGCNLGASAAELAAAAAAAGGRGPGAAARLLADELMLADIIRGESDSDHARGRRSPPPEPAAVGHLAELIAFVCAEPAARTALLTARPAMLASLINRWYECGHGAAPAAAAAARPAVEACICLLMVEEEGAAAAMIAAEQEADPEGQRLIGFVADLRAERALRDACASGGASLAAAADSNARERAEDAALVADAAAAQSMVPKLARYLGTLCCARSPSDCERRGYGIGHRAPPDLEPPVLAVLLAGTGHLALELALAAPTSANSASGGFGAIYALEPAARRVEALARRAAAAGASRLYPREMWPHAHAPGGPLAGLPVPVDVALLGPNAWARLEADDGTAPAPADLLSAVISKLKPGGKMVCIEEDVNALAKLVEMALAAQPAAAAAATAAHAPAAEPPPPAPAPGPLAVYARPDLLNDFFVAVLHGPA